MKLNTAKFGMLVYLAICAGTLLALIFGFPFMACGQVQLLSDSEMEYIRSVLPEVADAEISDMIEDRNTVWYNSRVMPPIYRLEGRFQDVNYNISGDNVAPHFEASKPDGQGGNANIDFPWQVGPGGTHRSPGVSDVKAFRLPEKRGGGVMPVAVHSTDWVFPIGTEFLEVVMLRGPDRSYVFDIRKRVRTRTEEDVDVVRPFRTPEELAVAITQLRPGWRSDQRLASAVARLEAEYPLARGRLTDRNPNRAFDVTAGIDTLPDLPAALVEQLLTEFPFQSVLGIPWREGTNGVTAFAPTVEAGFAVVPPKFDGTFLGASQESCNNCHKDVGTSARKHDPRRGWYGDVRGGDFGVISWHPQDPRNRNQLRPAFVRAGIVEVYDPRRHPAKLYNRLR